MTKRVEKFKEDSFLDNHECPLCGGDGENLIEGPIKEVKGEISRKVYCQTCSKWFRVIFEATAVGSLDIVDGNDDPEMEEPEESGLADGWSDVKGDET